MLILGSSPHTRGARETERVIAKDPGIIPAYAGSTSVHSRTPELSSDHPRIRGEHAPPAPRTFRSRGSSPHTRGAPYGGEDDNSGVRIIPAYAGSTVPEAGGLQRRTDHPRIRGEHELRWIWPSVKYGSSPHTRGAPVRRRRARWTAGIIPAYAGSTSAVLQLSKFSQDHPRIRGEHLCGASDRRTGSGSSPHTRGAP